MEAPNVYGIDEIEKNCHSCTDKNDTNANNSVAGGLLNLNAKTNILTKMGVLHNTYLKTYFILNEKQLRAKVLSPYFEYSLLLYYFFGVYKYKLHLSVSDATISVGKVDWSKAMSSAMFLMPFLQEKKVIFIEFTKLGLRCYLPFSEKLLTQLKNMQKTV